MRNVTSLNHKLWSSRFGWNCNVSRKNQTLLDKLLRIEHLEQKQLLTGTLNGIVAVNAEIDSNTPALVADDLGVDSPRLNLGSSNLVLSQTQPGSSAIFSGGRLGNGSGEFRNEGAFAALTSDGSIASWGHWSNSGDGTPTGAGYTRIFSNEGAFAALGEDGSIASWGEHSYGGRGAPTGTGYTEIFSTGRAFAALNEEGAITAWGLSDRGGSGAPTDLGYTRIFSSERSFAALAEDGTISSWGNSDFGGEGAPLGSGFTQIASSQRAFAALNSDGTIMSWGDAAYGASETPTDAGYVKVVASQRAFAAIKEDGSISSWGSEDMSAIPTDDGYVEIFANRHAFTAIKADGSLISWGNRYKGGRGAPEGTGFVEVVPTQLAFAALHADGSIATWGKDDYGAAGAPTDSGYTELVGSQRAFAALSADGSITVWGHANYGGSGAPTGTGYASITTNGEAFAALSDDGSISVWGDPDSGGTGAPDGSGFVTIAKPLGGESSPENPPETPPDTGQTQPGSSAIFSGGRLGNGSGEFRNEGAFAALTSDGSIASWGHWSNSGDGTPTGAGYTRIFSNEGAFAALGEDGSIASWGEHSYGGRGAPTGTGYTEIFSTGRAFAALNEEGAITAWGLSDRGGSGAPTDLGYTRIFSSERSFAALAEDGTISSWGNSNFGGEGAPLGSGFTQIASSQRAFAALNSDGTIMSWGDAAYGASETPTDAGYVKVVASQRAFAAIKEDGSISSWGSEDMSAIPTDDGYVEIFANRHAFTAIKADGSLISWGNRYKGGRGAPEGTGFVEVVPTQLAFAALHADGSIATWGKDDYGAAGAPTDSGYTELVGSQRAFAALSADGSITVWGHANYGGSGAPTGTGYASITTNGEAFAALSDDGSISVWGDPDSGGTGAPDGSGFVTIAKPLGGESSPENPPENLAPVIADQYFSIAGNSTSGTVVGALTASDPNEDSLAYSIVQNIDLDGDGVDAFRLEGNQLLVNDVDDLNADSTSPLAIAVEASDGLLSTSASVTVSVTSTEGVIFRIAAGDSDALDEALRNAQGGDIIELAAGSTYLGDFKLSKKEGDGVIVIRTSAYASLPEGRVSPEDAPLMAKLADRLGDSAIYTEEGASNYRIEGLEIVSLAETIGKLVNIGGGARTAEAFSNNITLDRCYVHGSPTQNIQRAILANGSNITVSNSYISEIHKEGIESQGFLAVLGTGPYTIENNFIEAAGENIMFGGANWGNRYPEFQPEGITIKNNHISKPDRWNKDSPQYDGSDWSVKNLVEFKIGSHILVEGNIIENVWQSSQDGPAVLIDPNESPMEDIVLRNNVIRSARYAVRIATGDPGLSNVTIENNLIYNMEWRLFVIGSAEDQKIDNVTIRNNTVLFDSERAVTTNDGYGNSQLTLSESTTSVENFIYQDNLIGGGRYAIKGTGTASGLASIENFMDNFDIRGNAIVDPFEETAESVYRIGDNYEENGDFYGDFSLQGTVEEVGFADTAFDDVEDFRIVANAALQAAGTGVDIDALILALGT